MKFILRESYATLTDQVTWSLFSLLASCLYMKNEKLSEVGILTLILTITYATSSLIKTRYLMPELNKLSSAEFVLAKQFYQPVVTSIFLAQFLVSSGIIILLQIYKISIFDSFLYVLLFNFLLIRDGQRLFSIYVGQYKSSSFANILGILIVVSYSLISQSENHILIVWISSLALSSLAVIKIKKEIRITTPKSTRKNEIKLSRQKIVVIDSFTSQMISIVTMSFYNYQNSEIVGALSLTYMACAAVSTTIATGFTGKINVLYLRKQTPERQIFKFFCIVESVMIVNTLIILLGDSIPVSFFGSSWNQARQLVLVALILNSTTVFVQFYAYPLLIHISFWKFACFRILNFLAVNILPIFMVTRFPIVLVISVQLVIFALLYIFGRLELRAHENTTDSL